MENAEEVFHFLEEFSKRKPKTIPQELNDYLAYVARTGDPVYQWSLVKSLFKEKLLNVITDFYESTPSIEIPPYPNVDPFNYDTMKNSLLERLDTFTSAPFTVQRICELLTYPRKQYNRIDKFMRAIEKNILVVSTREPGIQRHVELENGESAEPIVNGSDNNSEYNVDVEMEDMSWKENAEQQQSSEPQPGSSDSHISVDDIEARLQAKQEAAMDTQEKTTTQYESVTPPELNVTAEKSPEPESNKEPETVTTSDINDKEETKTTTDTLQSPEQKEKDVEMKTKTEKSNTLIIPEIKVDDAEMTEQRLNQESASTIEKSKEQKIHIEKETKPEVENVDTQDVAIDETSSDSNTKDEVEPKLISEASTSSEESSSSSDHTDGNSNSPKTDNEASIDVQEESNQSETNSATETSPEKPQEDITVEPVEKPQTAIETDNYSISDINSEIPQLPQAATVSEDSSDNNSNDKSDLPTEEIKEESKIEVTEASSEPAPQE